MGNVNADPFLNRRPIERTLVNKGQQQGDRTGLPIHPEFTEELGRVRAAIHRLTGAFILGRAGMLKGLDATTHHDFFDRFEKTFPDVRLHRGLRFVEGERISTAGGLTSGIDMALRVVERYFGRDRARQVAEYMEYQSTGWMV